MIVINRLWLWAYFLLGGMFFLIVYLIIAEIKNGRKRFGMVDGVKLAKRLREAGQGQKQTDDDFSDIKEHTDDEDSDNNFDMDSVPF